MAHSRWPWTESPRPVEFFLGILLLTRGLALCWPDESMSESVYSNYLTIMPEMAWGVVYTLAGVAQSGGVIINGRWRRSPLLRFFGSFVGFVTYAVLAVTFFWLSPVATSLAGTLYATLAGVSIWCILYINPAEVRNGGTDT